MEVEMQSQAAVKTETKFGWRVRGDGVAVVPRDPETVTKSGIILAGAANKLPLIGDVIGVGDKVPDVKVGDVVVFNAYSGVEVEVTHGGKKVVMLSESHVRLVQVRE